MTSLRDHRPARYTVSGVSTGNNKTDYEYSNYNNNYYYLVADGMNLPSGECCCTDHPPPSYDDALSDIPPDYNDTDALAVADNKYTSSLADVPSLPPPYERLTSQVAAASSSLSSSPSSLFDPLLPTPKVDFSAVAAEEFFRAHKKKKGNKGGAPAWPDNEEDNGAAGNNGDDAGDANGNGQNDGGGDGAGAGGAGGDGGGDGGGWGDDDGFTAAAGKKNKKNKNKKNKKNEAEGEEDGDKDGFGNLAEQDAAGAGAGAGSMWSDPPKGTEADPGDEWTTFGTTSSKKKKKNKEKGAKVGKFGSFVGAFLALFQLCTGLFTD